MKKWTKTLLKIIIIAILLLVIDLISIFVFSKPIFAIKEKNNDSTNVIYKGLLYNTYICHEYTVPQIKIKGTKYNCSHIIIEKNKKSKYEIAEIENVDINISNISSTGATVTIKDTNKNPHTYGEWYKIEKKINNNWYELKTKIDNYGFNLIGYLPDKNNEIKFIMDWEWLYGELDLGTYRILKQINNQYIGIEFSITTTSNSKIEVVKQNITNSNKFNTYLEKDNKTIYLTTNIKEIYYNESGKKIILKDYITTSWQTLDDAIKHLTDLLNHLDTLKDGGTTIHKSKDYDITIIKCNTISENKDIYIGDYSMNFDTTSMCK